MGKSIRPQEFDGLPAFLLADVEERCRGDWRRVTMGRDGSLIIHNSPVSSSPPKRRAATKKPPTASKPKPRSAAVEEGPERPPDTPLVPSPAVVWKRTVLPPALPPQRRAGRKTAPERVKPLQPPPAPVREGTARPHSPWDDLPDYETERDWKGADVGRLAFAFATLAREGIPQWITPGCTDDVLALEGMDRPAMEASLYWPERVEVAEETTKKGYPVLRFHRGSVCTVLGFRAPKDPKVIAVYFTGDALKEYMGRAGTAQGSGGGGARKEEGLPKNGPGLLRRLRALGAECAPLPGDSLKCLHKVTYQGQDLGQVPGDTITPRKEIETHYQRTQRRIAAINMKMSNSA